MEKKLIPYTFHILAHFIIFMTNFPFKKYWYVYFLKGGGGLRKCMFGTHLNVDNYKQTLTKQNPTKL